MRPPREVHAALSRAGLLVLLAAVTLLPLALAPRAEAFIYWYDRPGDFIARANLDGTGINEGLIKQADEARDVAVDSSSLYWTTGTSIARAKLDGTNVERGFIPEIYNAGSVAVDDDHLYWTIACCGTSYLYGGVGRANIDGSGVDRNFVTGLESEWAAGVAVDARHVYWGEQGMFGVEDAAIGRASLDGTSVDHDFISLPDDVPTALGVGTEHIYWVNGPDWPPTIARASLDGTEVDQSFITGDRPRFNPVDLAVDTAHLHWANPWDKAGTIGRANLDGTGVDQEFLNLKGGPAQSLAVDALTDTRLEGKTTASRTQRQRGGRIGVEVKVKAKERLTAKARGKIKLNPTYKLKAKAVECTAAETRTLKLIPKRAKAEKIAAALKRDDKATAKLKVELTDLAGNSKTERLRVRLRR